MIEIFLGHNEYDSYFDIPRPIKEDVWFGLIQNNFKKPDRTRDTLSYMDSLPPPSS